MTLVFRWPSRVVSVVSVVRESFHFRLSVVDDQRVAGDGALLVLGADQPGDGFGPTGFSGPHHAVAQVIIEQTQRHIIQRGGDGTDLGENVNAVCFFVDHPVDAPGLAFNALDPGQIPVLVTDVPVTGSVGRGLVCHGWVFLLIWWHRVHCLDRHLFGGPVYGSFDTGLRGQIQAPQGLGVQSHNHG